MLTVDWRDTAVKEYLVEGSLGRLAAFWACCYQACFSYLGSEIIGLAANEAERPRETLPKAARRVSQRVVLYCVGSVFVLGLNLSVNDPELAWSVNNRPSGYVSPFVLMAQRAGLRGVGNVVNGVVLVAALSAANADLYTSVPP